MAEGGQSLGAASFQISLAGIREFLTGMAQARAATAQMAQGVEADLRRSAKALDGNIAALERLAAAERAAGRDASLYDGRIAGLRKQREEIERTIQAQQRLNAAARSPAGMSVSLNSEQAIAARVARLREERSAVDMSSASYRTLGQQIRQLEQKQGGGGGLQSLLGLAPGAAGVAGQLAVAGASIAAIGAATAEGVRRFAEYDGALKQLGALSGATGSQLSSLNEAIRETANRSGIGKVALAQLGSELARTGFSAQQITEALDGVVTVAQATGEDVQTASGVVGLALKLWNLPAEDAGRVGDVLAKSANLSATSLGSLAETLKYVGPAAASSGQSLEDVVTLTTLLAEGGIKGSMAGTGLTAVLTRLKTASAGVDSEMGAMVRGNAKRVEAFKQIGAAVRDADGNMRPLLQVLPEIKAKLEALSPQDRDLIANALFGEEGGRSFLALVNQSSEKMAQFSSEISNSTGESKKLQQQQESLGRTLGRTAQKFGALLESLGALAEALGLGLLLEGLNGLIGVATDGITGIAESIKALTGASWDGLKNLFKGPEDSETKKINELNDALKRLREEQRKRIDALPLNGRLEGNIDPSLSAEVGRRENQIEREKKNYKDFAEVYNRATITQQQLLKQLSDEAMNTGTNVEALAKKKMVDPEQAARLRDVLDLYKQIRAEKEKAAAGDDGAREWEAFIRAQQQARQEIVAQGRVSADTLARQVGLRQADLRVLQQMAEREGETGEKAKGRIPALEKEVKALQDQLQIRQAIAQAEAQLSEAATRATTQRLQSYERLTDLYRQQVTLGAQIASEQGGMRTDALQARLQELEAAGKGDSGAALALRREILQEEQAIAETRAAAEQQSLEYEALKLGYAQQRERLEAQIAANQAQATLIQARLDQQASGAEPGSAQGQLDTLKVQTAAEGVRLARERLALLGPEQQAERQNLALQYELLEVQQQRAQAERDRRAKALGISLERDPGLSLQPGESRGILLRPDPSLVQELSSAYEQSTQGLADRLDKLVGQGDGTVDVLKAIAAKETNITINVDSAGGVNTVAGL